MNYHFPRCQVTPLPDDQVLFQIDGVERLRWHFGAAYPRPFFFPLAGPSGAALTRMGHPGAPNHDHHRSIWFAHAKVLGIDFWSDRTTARIRQKQWLCYQDGDDEAAMAVLLGWYDGHDPQELLEQELIAAIRPGEAGETFVELQSTFRPRAESLEFGQTNFGFLAVRVAKSLSAYFGGGQIVNSEGVQGEGAIFARAARWMDYSGPVPGERKEGIAYFDHPENSGYPVSWHVREDGWMGAAPCLHRAVSTSREQPLKLRYLLLAHSGAPLGAERGEIIAAKFAETPPWELSKAGVKHVEHAIRRRDRL
jgi:hypothetical protein